MASTLTTAAVSSTTLILDPSTDCHQRSRWETPPAPDPSTPPPLAIHRPRFVAPLIRRPGRIIYGHGDASQSGGAGRWATDYNGFLWVAPMGGHQSPADSLSRWMTLHEVSGEHNRWRVGGVEELTDEQSLLRIQTEALVQDVEVEESSEMELSEMEYVD
jgi:hypothetical protein